MDLLWREGPLTLAEAHEHYGKAAVGYTTMQTRLNRLVEKKLAKKAGRPARYTAVVKRRQVQAGHLDQLIAKLGGGSVVPLVAQLVQDRRVSRDELEQLKTLIENAETATKSSAGTTSPSDAVDRKSTRNRELS